MKKICNICQGEEIRYGRTHKGRITVTCLTCGNWAVFSQNSGFSMIPVKIEENIYEGKKRI